MEKQTKSKMKWIKGAIKHPGAFKAKAERAGKTTREFAREHAHDSGTLGKQARLAETLMSMRHKTSAAKPSRSGLMKKMYGSTE